MGETSVPLTGLGLRSQPVQIKTHDASISALNGRMIHRSNTLLVFSAGVPE